MSPEDPGAPGASSQEETRRAVNAALEAASRSPIARQLVHPLLMCGVRCGEVVGLNLSDVRSTEGEAT